MSKKKTNDARVGNPEFGGDYQKAVNIRSIEAVIFDKLSKASKANKEQFAILSINIKGDGQYAVTASFKPWRAPQSEWYKKTIMVSGPKAVFGEDKQTMNKTHDAKDPSKMSPQEIATELANNKKRRIELAKKLVRSDKEKAELQELGDRWRELYNYQKSSHIPGWYGTFPGASLDSAEKTWSITDRMMQGQFSAKDAEGSEVKNSTGVVKCKKCGSQLWNLRSGEYYCTKCGAKMDAPLSKDAKSEGEWDLKFRLRHALPGETMSNKLGTVRGILAREGFDRNFKSYGDRVFSATHSRMGFTVNIETEPTDDSRKVLKIRQVWFSDSKPATDAPADPKLLSNKEIYAELKTHPDKRREQALMNELKRRATLARRDYEGLANYMNGDAMMSGANYRPALDAAVTKDAAADGRETWKWDTMFMDLAEKVYNKLQMAGITSNVRKSGQYYHIEAKVTPDERKKIEFFIKGHTIHSVGGYRSMDYPGK